MPVYMPTNGLIGWYPFNGSVVDESGNGNDGENSGAVLTVDRNGDVNSAYYFGMDAMIRLESLEDYDWGFAPSTVMAWANYQGLGDENGVIIRYDDCASSYVWGITIHESPTELVFYDLNRNGVHDHSLIINPYSPSGWTHYAFVKDPLSGSNKAYVNGELVGQISFAASFPPSGEGNPQLLIGSCGGWAHEFGGDIDDIAFFDRALSDLEISNIFNEEPLIYGCMDSSACNYDSMATSPGSCEHGCLNCGLGTVWDEQLEQCVVIESCQEDLDYDGVIGVNDLMSLLASFGTDCSTYEEEIGCGTPIEYHGYEYQTVLIGDQCWFAENLRTELYLNGEGIPSGLDRETWCNATYGATTYYAETADSCISDPSVNFPGVPCENPEGALEFYGRLYNWHAVNDERELCPSGWHVPSSAEWLALKEYVDASYPNHSGLVLREHGSWRNPVTQLDLFGFKLRPGGYRNDWNGDGSHYRSAGRVGTWFWTADNGSDEGRAYSFDHRAFNEINSLVMQNLQGPSQNQHQFGFSVRCKKD